MGYNAHTKLFYCNKPMALLKSLKIKSEQTTSTPLYMGWAQWEAFLGKIRHYMCALTRPWTELWQV